MVLLAFHIPDTFFDELKECVLFSPHDHQVLLEHSRAGSDGHSSCNTGLSHVAAPWCHCDLDTFRFSRSIWSLLVVVEI